MEEAGCAVEDAAVEEEREEEVREEDGEVQEAQRGTLLSAQEWTTQSRMSKIVETNAKNEF